MATACAFHACCAALALGVGNGGKKKMIHREYSFGYDVVSLSIHACGPKRERKFAEI